MSDIFEWVLFLVWIALLGAFVDWLEVRYWPKGEA